MLKLSWELMKRKSKMGKVFAACVFRPSGSLVSFVCTSIWVGLKDNLFKKCILLYQNQLVS